VTIKKKKKVEIFGGQSFENFLGFQKYSKELIITPLFKIFDEKNSISY